MNEKLAKNSPKLANMFICECCDYTCSKKSDLMKHNSTTKHKNRTILNGFEQDINTSAFSCRNCNKKYKGRNGLWYHEQKCLIKEMNKNSIIENTIVENTIVENTIVENTIVENTIVENTIFDSSANEIKNLTNLVLELVKSNTEMQKQIIDVCKNTQQVSINNSHNNNNSHNKTFNLQFFLNEQCKDAMNLSDFVKSFKLQLSDLELVGDEGYINGMTKIILAKLNGMDENTRPFHCTDAKRETIYVKEDDVWVREGPDNSKIAAAIKAIGHQNFFILKEYKALHPDCESTYSEYNDHYMNLIMKSAGCQKEDIAKVIKKLAKEIVIAK
jgi:hypothetical protein